MEEDTEKRNKKQKHDDSKNTKIRNMHSYTHS